MFESKGKLKTAAVLIATIVLLSALLLMLDVSMLTRSFQDIDPLFFMLALCLTPLFVAIKAGKWHYLVNTKAHIAYVGALKSYLAGTCIGLLTPARAGELSRVIYLPVKNKGAFAGLVVIDKLFDLSVLILLACAGSAIMMGQMATILLSALAAVIILLILSLHRINDLISRNQQWSKNKILTTVSSIIAMRPADIFKCLGLTFLGLTVTLLQGYILVLAFEPVSYLTILFSFPLIILTNILPVTVGGLGVREGASVLLLTQFGVSSATAFNAAFLLFFINTFLPDLAGLAFIFREHTKTGPGIGIAGPTK